MDSNLSESAAISPPMDGMASQPAAVSTGLPANTAAAISYFTLIPAIYFLIAPPYDHMPFVRFHAIQSVLFGLGAFGAQSLLLYLVPGGLRISVFLSLAFFVLWVLVVLKSMKGEWFKIPVIGDFALANSGKR